MYCRILAYFEKTFSAPTYIGAEKAKKYGGSEKLPPS